MWESILTVVAEQAGFHGIVEGVLLFVCFLLWRAYNAKDRHCTELQQTVLEMSEKRLTDVIEDRERYEELAEGFEKSVDLLVKFAHKKSESTEDPL